MKCQKSKTIRNSFFAVCLLLGNVTTSHVPVYNPTSTELKTQHAATLFDRIKGCTFGGLIGDALGAPTEFINNTDALFKKFPSGITGYDALKKYNLLWKNGKTGEQFAPYTDDTAMARITFRVLLESKANNWDLNTTMSELAVAYIQDMNNPTGWAMKVRAPGLTCLKSVKKLKADRDSWLDGQRIPRNWWQAGDSNGAGCGSVMRAHPFGLVFADDPQKAAIWAAEHSKITHGHPAAQAACAAMAIGVAYGVQGENPAFIIDQMIAWAKKYEPAATRYNTYTNKEEKSTWAKIEHAVSLAQKTEQELQSFFEDFYMNDYKAMYSGILYHVLYPCSKKNKIFDLYQGWAADDAIAAATYIFAITPEHIHNAIFLGVHTPGDSDSIASMAGALVGARVGTQQLCMYHNPTLFEGSKTLESYARQAAQLMAQ